MERQRRRRPLGYTGQQRRYRRRRYGLLKLIAGKGKDTPAGDWDGLIDDLRIYDRALSADEISLIVTPVK